MWGGIQYKKKHDLQSSDENKNVTAKMKSTSVYINDIFTVTAKKLSYTTNPDAVMLRFYFCLSTS